MKKNIVFRRSGTWRKIMCMLCVLSMCTLAAFAQQRVSGTVTDASGEPVIGANIVEKGVVANGTVTDIDGNFTLNVRSGATLTASFIGYVTQEIAVGNRTTLNITLTEDSQALDEVVVVGYGTRVKGALTGSIAKAGSQTFETRPLVSATGALQGAMPGVTIIRGTTRPGYDDIAIQIRGYSSMNGNSPLVLIDGIAGNLNLLNPNDIEDVTALKDAAASIYGARASDGVILVTTKKGKAGKPQLSYSGNFGVKVPHFLKEMATTANMIDIYQEGRINSGLVPASQEVVDKIKAGNAPPEPNSGWLAGFENYPGFFGTYDWLDMVIGNATLQNHDVSISGGSDNSVYLFSAGYNRDEGIFKYGAPAISNRYNLAANNSFKNLFNRLDVDTRIQLDSRRTDEPTETDGTLDHLSKIWRFLPMYNPAGNYYMWQGFVNPANLLQNGGRRYMRNDRLTFNAKANLRIVEGLNLIAQYGVAISQNDTKTERPSHTYYDWENKIVRTDNSPNSVSYDPNYDRYSSYTAYLEYNKALADRHNFNLMAGAAHEEDNYDSKSLTGQNLLSNEIFTMNLSDKTDIKYLTANTNASDWALTSYFGRLGYNFDRKYLLDVTIRADGSSRFAPAKRWSAVFPAVSAAWNLGDEAFVRSLGLFDQLKLRLSWGQTGNQQLSGNYGYIPLVGLNNAVYPFGQPGVNAAGATSGIASKDRTWETITTTNVGLDFSLLNARLSGSVDVYIKRNADMLVRQDLPALFGGSAPTQNIGELETKGFDLTLAWKDKVGDFRYGISFILSDSKNKLVELRGSDTKAEGLVTARQGYSLSSYFGYKSAGIIQTEAQLAEYKKLGGTVPTRINLGDMMYEDIDGDGKITAFGDDGKSGDLVYLGNRLPRYTYSSNIDLSYRNVDLNLFWQGVGQRNAVRTGDFMAPFPVYWFQPMAYFHNKTWAPDRPDAPFPRALIGNQGWSDVFNWNYRYSDSPHRLINSAYLRLKLVTLAWRLPQSFCSRLKLESVRIYTSGQDLLTFAKGTWGGSYDPEEDWQRTDAQTYPFHKTVSFGIDVKF